MKHVDKTYYILENGRVFIDLTVTCHGFLDHALCAVCTDKHICIKIRCPVGELDNGSLVFVVSYSRHDLLIGNGTIWHVGAKAVPQALTADQHRMQLRVALTCGRHASQRPAPSISQVEMRDWVTRVRDLSKDGLV